MATKARQVPVDLDEDAIRVAMSGLPERKQKPLPYQPQEEKKPEPILNKERESTQEIGGEEKEPIIQPEEYTSLFLRKKELSERKYAYLSRAHHETITRIVNFLGDGLSISGYVDNVLEEHFRKYAKEINELYEKRPNRKLIE